MTPANSALADRVLAGDRRAIARAISIIEDEQDEARILVREMFPKGGGAAVVGVTGPPGAGKSTLVDRLTAEFRRQSKNVGILAVDPSSPFTGGALLGDRLRMQGHAADEGVFIRSMATRGHLGGLARATADALIVLDAAGFNVILIETVGVGQDEIDIVRTADISIVVLVPGAGDDVQALKAGIMEIADIFVINKADREGADRLASAIEGQLSLKAYGPEEWRPPIVRTIATSGAGVAELMQAVDAVAAHRLKTAADRHSRRRVRDEHRLREILSRGFIEHLERSVLAPGELSSIVDKIEAREVDPYTAAAALIGRVVTR